MATINNIDVFAILSERATRRLIEDDVFQPRRRERKLRIDGDDQAIIIELERKFEPTPEMIELRQKVVTARTKAIKFLRGLRLSGRPNIEAIKKFRKLVGDAEYMQVMWTDVARKAREVFEAEEQKESQRLLQHQERGATPLTSHFKNNHNGEGVLVPLTLSVPELRKLGNEFESFIETLNTERDLSGSRSSARKEEIRKKRRVQRDGLTRMWLNHMTQAIELDARGKYAEDEIDDNELRRTRQIADELRRARRLDKAARIAYAEDLIPQEDLEFFQRFGL